MLRQTGSNVCIFVLAFAALAVAKPPPQSWSSSGNPGPVFTRSLGPPFGAPGISSITVPYKPKASPFFPKFVDPTAMIAKKTDMLSNLFSGLGPIDFAAISAASSKDSGAPGSPLLYAAVDESPEAKQVDAGVEQVNEKDTMKRGVVAKGGAKVGSPKLGPFSPFAPKFSPFAPQFSPFAPSFSPYGPNFGPGASGFPFTGFPSNFAGPGSDSDAYSTRRRRSIVGAAGEGGKALGPPPAYPGLAPISEEPESLESKLLKLYNPSAGGAKEMLPGMFGPFGPFSPYAAAPYDPTMFIPKTPKATFLDTLFKSLATSTPATSDVVNEPVTELPVPKSTIVPPGFWAPSAIIPSPTEYTDKVSTFLDKLFSSLLLNKTATATADGAGKTVLARALIEDPEKGKLLVSRSIQDVKNIAAAKDTIVDSIISELGDLKTNMISTLNDYIVYQKTLPVGKASKKPLKPVSPFAAFFAPPTPDPSLPFKQRMAVLSEVFDMLTGLEKNISVAVQEAIKSSTDAPIAVESKPGDEDESLESVQDTSFAGIPDFNATLLDAIKSRLANLDKAIATGLNKPVGGSYNAAPAKRNVEDEDYFIPEYYDNHRDDNRDQYKRAVQMQMHQGYQSMPPGTIESVQAGGGTVPGHQGGGIKLLNSQNFEKDWEKSSAWAEYFKNQNEGRKHHHNHH